MSDTTGRSVSGIDVELRHGPYQAAIASVGASLRRLRHDGVDLVVGYEADEIRPAYRGAILAPWPNRVVDGRYTDDGIEQQLALTEPARGHALHGLMVWHDFAVTAQDEPMVIMSGHIVAQQGYPHQVRVDVSYSLDDHGLLTEVTATNLGRSRAPWGTGPHPYLRAGDGHVDDWTLSLPADQVLEVTADRLIPVRITDVEEADDGVFDFRRPRAIGDTFVDHAFTGLSRDDDGWARVRLTGPSGRGVSAAWDDSCSWVQIHTADVPGSAVSRTGLAVEPMTCAPDAFNSGHGLVHLEPAGTHTARWRIGAVG